MNRLSGKGAFISKSEAGMLQAVAVMLMVWHHLFGFPDRVAVPYVLVLDRFFPIETFMAYFGRICIAVFAFTSGYGMRKKIVSASKSTGILKNYRTVLLQLLKFLSRYWIVFMVFIPMGILMKVFPLDYRKFLQGVLGNGGGYNAEWWYVGYYVRFLLLFPILNFIADVIQKRIPVSMHVLMAMAVIAVLLWHDRIPKSSFIGVLLCFAEGMYFVDSKIFEKLYRPFTAKPWLRLVVGIVLFGVVFILRFKSIPDYVLVAVFVFSIMLICKTELIMHWLRPVMLFVGKYSTYIWLTHTFFGYYYFQKITFAPRASWLIFLWCMVLSIASGIVLEKMLTLITKGIKQLFHKK